jgi:polysaccharide pyruvyl transferase WcaK-like protein
MRQQALETAWHESSASMKILVDHGAYANFGDLAMLDAAVDRLRRIGRAQLYVCDAPLDWRWPDIARVHYSVFAPGSLVNRITGAELIQGQVVGGLPRVSNAWRSLMHTLLAVGATAHLVPIRTSTGWRALGQWCKEYDALFIAGGGDMNDFFPEALWRCCALIHAFAGQGKPILLSGQQLGPLQHVASRQLMRSALRRANFVGVREPTESLRICRDSGLANGQFAMYGDDSLGIAPAGSREVDALMREYQLSPRGFLAVNLRIATYSKVSPEAVHAFAEALGELAGRLGLELVAVPVSTDEGDSDIEAARSLAGELPGVRMKVIGGRGLSPSLLKGLLGQAFGAVGVSYHFNTFALSQGVPSVALYSGAYYKQKANGLAALWGDPRLAMPVEALGADTAQRIQAVFQDAALREHLQNRAAQAARDWESMFAANIIQRLEELCLKSP